MPDEIVAKEIEYKVHLRADISDKRRDALVCHTCKELEKDLGPERSLAVMKQAVKEIAFERGGRSL